LSPESSICVRWVVALVMLNVHEYVVLLCERHELLVVFEQLDRWFCDEDMNAAFDGVQRDGIVCGVWGEDGDCEG
jgi:hypothetical protein